MKNFKKIFQKKVITGPAGNSSSKLKRVLGVHDLIALGVGATIGTGIFVLSGVAASRYAGPGVIISFILSGIAGGLAALVYSELAAMFPAAGSAYTYTYAAMGEITAWLVGWNLTLSYTVACAAVAMGWGSYLVDLLKSAGIFIPQYFTSLPLGGGIVNLPPLLILGIITYLLIAGAKESSKVNKAVVLIKVGAIILFIALGLSKINPANWHPFLPWGIQGVLQGASIVFFAYIGFDAVATAAEEVRNPKKDMPLGITGTLIVSTILYLGVAAVLTGMVKYSILDTPSPVTTALIHRGIPWAASLISVGALAGLTSVILVNFFAQSRILFAMSRDGLLPPVFSRLHPRFKTPYFSILSIAAAAATLSSLLPIHIIAELANIGTLSTFAAVSLSVIILRHTQPHLQRPYKVPLMPLLPLLSFAASVYLILNLSPSTWYRFLLWTALGFFIYFLYSIRHTEELHTRHLMPKPAMKHQKGSKPVSPESDRHQK